MHIRSLAIVAAFSLSLLVAPPLFKDVSPVHAQLSVAAGLPFGGLVSIVNACPCNGGFMAVVGLPSPIVWYATLGPVYQYALSPAAVHPGQWNLGLAVPGGTCLTAAKCIPSIPPVTGTLMFGPGAQMLGTSI